MSPPLFFVQQWSGRLPRQSLTLCTRHPPLLLALLPRVLFQVCVPAHCCCCCCCCWLLVVVVVVVGCELRYPLTNGWFGVWLVTLAHPLAPCAWLPSQTSRAGAPHVWSRWTIHRHIRGLGQLPRLWSVLLVCIMPCVPFPTCTTPPPSSYRSCSSIHSSCFIAPALTVCKSCWCDCKCNAVCFSLCRPEHHHCEVASARRFVRMPVERVETPSEDSPPFPLLR